MSSRIATYLKVVVFKVHKKNCAKKTVFKFLKFRLVRLYNWVLDYSF